jgi:hypothetical protein
LKLSQNCRVLGTKKEALIKASFLWSRKVDTNIRHFTCKAAILRYHAFFSVLNWVLIDTSLEPYELKTPGSYDFQML